MLRQLIPSNKISQFIAAIGMVCGLALSADAQITTIVANDSFADGDLSSTGALDMDWFTTNSSSGLEISTGS